MGQFVFALYQLIFKFRPQAYAENYPLSPFLYSGRGVSVPTPKTQAIQSKNKLTHYPSGRKCQLICFALLAEDTKA